MKKTFFIILFTILFLPLQVINAAEAANLYFFYGDGCPHCAKEEVFLDAMEEKYGNLEIYRYEVWHNSENAQTLSNIAQALDINIQGVPVLIGGDKVITGYYNDQTTGKKVEELIQELTTTRCVDQVGDILGTNPADGQCTHDCAAGGIVKRADTNAPSY